MEDQDRDDLLGFLNEIDLRRKGKLNNPIDLHYWSCYLLCFSSYILDLQVTGQDRLCSLWLTFHNSRRPTISTHTLNSFNIRAEHEIYIGNYPVKFKEPDVRKLFEDHQVKVGAIQLKHDGLKVFAFAETDSVDEIEKAKGSMEGVEIQGRKLRVRR